MEYLDGYKDFVSTIKDPLERLDDIEVYLDDFERGFDQIEGNHEMGLISNKEYKSLVKERDGLFLWGNEEITSIKAQHSDFRAGGGDLTDTNYNKSIIISVGYRY